MSQSRSEDLDEARSRREDALALAEEEAPQSRRGESFVEEPAAIELDEDEALDEEPAIEAASAAAKSQSLKLKLLSPLHGSFLSDQARCGIEAMILGPSFADAWVYETVYHDGEIVHDRATSTPLGPFGGVPYQSSFTPVGGGHYALHVRAQDATGALTPLQVVEFEVGRVWSTPKEI
jgi:hypothetical protein